MKKRTFLGGFVAGCATMLLAATTFVPAQDQDPEGMSQADMEQMMQEFAEKYGNPTSQHEKLAERAGLWTYEFEHPGPDGTPQTVTGQANYSVVMGGRYLLGQYRGEFMGDPFEGVGITGYDRIKQKYVSIWLDNGSTTPMFMEGTRNGDTLTFEGKAPSHMQMGELSRHRIVERQVDPDTFVMQMYEAAPDGTMTQHMEMTYTRNEEAQGDTG